MNEPNATPPTLEEQMAAQARLRAAAGVPDQKSTMSVAKGCWYAIGLMAIAVIAFIAVTGGWVAWWLLLTN